MDRLGRDCNKSPIPLFNVVGRKLAVQLLSFVLYCVPDRSLRTYGNIEMGEGGLQVVFAISCKNNLSDLSVPPFNVTDCSYSNLHSCSQQLFAKNSLAKIENQVRSEEISIFKIKIEVPVFWTKYLQKYATSERKNLLFEGKIYVAPLTDINIESSFLFDTNLFTTSVVEYEESSSTKRVRHSLTATLIYCVTIHRHL